MTETKTTKYSTVIIIPSKITVTPITLSMIRRTSSSTSTSTESSFFHDTTFLDNQRVFYNNFDTDPLILGTHPTNGAFSNCFKRVRTYADKLMLDIFIEICSEGYVGGNNASSKIKLVHKICKHLQMLKQAHVPRGGYKYTPDKLYVKCIIIVTGLPDCVSLWSIILCSVYVSALITNLKDKMEETTFDLPPLNSMGNKPAQIQGL